MTVYTPAEASFPALQPLVSLEHQQQALSGLMCQWNLDTRGKKRERETVSEELKFCAARLIPVGRGEGSVCEMLCQETHTQRQCLLSAT